MSVDENLQVVDRWLEAYNAKDWERFGNMFTESIRYRLPSVPEPLEGRERVRKFFERAASSLPDARVKKERSFGQDDWVCWEGIWMATHKGPIKAPGGRTISATNKPFQVPVAMLYRIQGGKIAEGRDYYDWLGLITQLGVST